MSDSDAVSASPASSVAPLFLSRDEIVAAPTGRRFENVPVDEWKPGAVVRVSSLSSEMRDALETFLIESRKLGRMENVRAFYVWLCAVDLNGDRLFHDIADVKALGNLNAAPIDRIFRVTLRLNDVGDAAVETEAKNSESESGATSSSLSL